MLQPPTSPALDVRAPESELLAPYVPRLLIDWVRELPGARWQAVDGSIAFVDISGFTQLTERLSRRGKIGAEQMSDTLDDCFGDLLAVAYMEGAGLVKWGGDAVLLLFRGDDHALRASRAAVEMQRRISEIGRIRAGGSTVTLRMSVGVHSGEFDFFIAGDVHRELVITGPASTTVVAMESAAEAGEVLVSARTAAQLEPRFLGARKGPGVLLRSAPELPPSPPPPVDVADLDLTPYLPPRVREYVVAERREAEHRLITVAFIEFSGTDDLLVARGPDALVDALDECIGVVQREADRHQVTFLETDISANGGKILLAAGAPASSGNDEERMLRTVRAIADRQRALPLRIGVNSGRVFAGDFGPPFRRTYSVKGDDVNLAARLMSKAIPGQILTTTDVLMRSATFFASEALEPFSVKGKSALVQAFAIGPALRDDAGRAPASPLIGREAELAKLLEGLEAARAWQGRALEVVAEAGLGKSRLVEELERRAPDVDVLRATAEEYEAASPYFPFRRLLRDALHLEGEEDPAALGHQLRDRVDHVAPGLLPWLPLIAGVFEADVPATPEVEALDERFRRTRLEEAVRELLGFVQTRPTMLIFEDAHWLDDASRHLVGALTQGIENRPWLLVATRRPDGKPLEFAGAPDRIELRPLDLGMSVALADAATEAEPVAPHVVAALAERSGGNPLFLRELLAGVAASASVETLPDSIEVLLAAQVDRLNPTDRIVLRAASVLGARFAPDLLEAALGHDAPTLDDSVWQRLAGFFVYDRGEVRFRHALVRDAAYEGLAFRRRRELHSRVGDTIASRAGDRADDAAEALSLHFFAAGRMRDAWRYSCVAANRAKAVYANVEAATFYERALRAAAALRGVPAGEVAAIAEALGDARFRLGEFGRATDAYRRARGRVRDEHVEQARLMLKEAFVPWRAGRYGPTLRWIRRGLNALAGLDGTAARGQRARLLAWNAVVRQKQGRSAEAVDLCRRAIEEADRAGARDALAHAYYVLDWALVSLGRLDEATHNPKALALYEELGDLSGQAAVLNYMGVVAYFRGGWDEALDHYERAQAAWEKIGDRWAATYPTANRGEILSDQGRLDEADALFRSALRVLRASGESSFAPDVLSHLGRLAARRGRFEEAHRLFDEAREAFAAAGEQSDVAVTDLRRADCLLFEGKGADALRAVDDVAARSAAPLDSGVLAPMFLRVRGWALVQTGRVDEGRSELVRALEAGRRLSADAEIALALQALERLARNADEDGSTFARDREEIVTRLGIVASPAYPLVARA